MPNKIRKENTKLASILFFTFITLILFSPVFEKMPFLAALNIDNMLTFLCFIGIILFQLKQPKALMTQEYLVIALLLIIIVLGLFGNRVANVYGWTFIVLDIWSICKCFIAYFFGRLAFRPGFFSSQINGLVLYSKWVIGVLFLLLLVNLVYPIWPSTEIRMGIKTQYLIFPHATYLSATVFFCMLFLGLKNVRYHIPFLAMGGILIFFAARNKGLIFIGIYFFMLLFQHYAKKKSFKISYLILPVITLIASFWEIIDTRLLSSTTSARSLLYQAAFKIADMYAPFGAGFASFGSGSSVKNYSHLYDKFRFYEYYGFTRENPQYLNDSFIAMFIAQFGYIGTACFALILLIFLLMINRRSGRIQAFTLVLFLYAVTSLFTELYLTTSLGIITFFLIGIAFGDEKEKPRLRKDDLWKKPLH
ncbi:hypothetical protein [Listeria booriae]|uniref:Polysaccharide polymerase n=3 Tax=Listeria booriae TaxID=1552123 RepID=A0A099W4H7_9LIST|nr:hypothetical protein [Listeria booriae]KGL38955.1 hypothetical protein EP57_13550 [Listeria booriae]MBC2117077.1 hypothetical protein [Listeria booriae]MBC2195960.1 hypothetical protein [Listeria booriae]STY45766.1 Uncharacterised protein [Listeria booriae]